MSTTSLVEYLEGVAAAKQAAPARVEAFPHPNVPLTTLYLITGSPNAIRGEIWRLREKVDAVFGGEPGRAVFSEPIRDGATYVAMGQVTLFGERADA